LSVIKRSGYFDGYNYFILSMLCSPFTHKEKQFAQNHRVFMYVEIPVFIIKFKGVFYEKYIQA